MHLPLPPFDLRQRVGAVTSTSAVLERALRKASWWDPDPAKAWLRQGRMLAELLCEQLPADFSIDGARVLDFGCGAGRVLRHLVDAVGDGELHGVDIDAPSIEWLQVNASPPFQVATCDETPGLPYPDDHFDLVYAYSVFTHITDQWAGWLLELRRVLRPGGVLFASVIGPQTGAELGLAVPEPLPAGMYVFGLGNPWDIGGPVTVHDDTWLAEHWGRAFEIARHSPRMTGDPWPHDVVVARARPGQLSEDDLLVPGDDGALAGLAQRAQLEILRSDAVARSAHHEGIARQQVEAIDRARTRIEAEAPVRLAELTRRYEALAASDDGAR